MNAVVALVVALGAVIVRSLIVAGLRVGPQRRARELDAPASPTDRARTRGRRQWFVRRWARRTRADVERRLPSLADGVARELRSGATLTTALFAAGDLAGGTVAADLDRVARRIAGGADLLPSLEQWSGERASVAVDRFVAVVSLGSEIGGELAPAFELTADSLRDRLALLDEIGSLTSQSRASGALLTGLPPFAALGLAMLDPASGRFLLASLPGLVCVVTACLLDLVAWRWMRGLARSVR